MFLLGLTGDIASGKSSVARLLQERGAAHIDSDVLVHELYRDADFAQRLQTHLRENTRDDSAFRVLDSLIGENGIDRQALGKLVFADAALLRALEEFVHPAVSSLRDAKLSQLETQVSPPRVAVLESVKLVESGQAQKCDRVWWICVSRATQLQRLQEFRGLSAHEAELRLKNQPAHEEKLSQLRALKIPFLLLQNDDAPEKLAQTVDAEWNRIII